MTMPTPTPRTDALTARMATELDRPLLVADHTIELCDLARELERALTAAEATIARLEGRMCLICGRSEPCTEAPDACTFDPSPLDAAKRFRDRAVAAQAALEEARKVSMRRAAAVFKLTAELCRLAEDNDEKISRPSVMSLVTQWRYAHDAARAKGDGNG